jgi:hypothetical protein
MTRKAWTTDLQKEWLEARLAAFRDAQAQKIVMKKFFPEILKAWKEEWPIPLPTDEEITSAGSLDKAKAAKTKKEESVRDLSNKFGVQSTDPAPSMCRAGSITIPMGRHLGMGRVAS